VICDLVRKDTRGILDITKTGCCSWFEAALRILRQARRGSQLRPPHHHSPSGLLGQGSGLFRSFTGESLCPWNEVTQLAGSHRANLEELREQGELVWDSDQACKVSNLYFMDLVETRSASPRGATAPKGQNL